MSRLQVGGLALLIQAVNPKNLGVVVKIISHGNSFDWIVDGDLDTSHLPRRRIGLPFGAMSSQLLPLGDKQTQDEIAKELDIA